MCQAAVWPKEQRTDDIGHRVAELLQAPDCDGGGTVHKWAYFCGALLEPKIKEAMSTIRTLRHLVPGYSPPCLSTCQHPAWETVRLLGAVQLPTGGDPWGITPKDHKELERRAGGGGDPVRTAGPIICLFTFPPPPMSNNR